MSQNYFYYYYYCDTDSIPIGIINFDVKNSCPVRMWISVSTRCVN